jgi:hypothetical protein
MNRDFTRYQPLPLTPALSRRERENCSPSSAQANAFSPAFVSPADLPKVGAQAIQRGIISERRLLFPLPEGEVQGEVKAVRELQAAQQLNSSRP